GFAVIGVCRQAPAAVGIAAGRAHREAVAAGLLVRDRLGAGEIPCPFVVAFLGRAEAARGRCFIADRAEMEGAAGIAAFLRDGVAATLVSVTVAVLFLTPLNSSSSSPVSSTP